MTNSIVEEIQARIKECMKSGEAIERDLLRTVLGEIQTIESRTGKMDDDSAVKVVRRFRDNAKEMLDIFLGHATDDAIKGAPEVEFEISIYEQYIPKSLSVEQIHKNITIAQDLGKIDILGAGSDGQATGIAMGYFKRLELNVQGKEVAEIVKKFRSENETS